MGLAPAWADDDGGERLAFGGLGPLVGLMQETSVRNLVPVLVEKLRAGTELKELVVNPHNAAACLVLSGYEVARDRQARDVDFRRWSPRPLADVLGAIKTTGLKGLLTEAESAILANQREIASAVVHRCGALGHDPAPVFGLLLEYAVSEAGALHVEKYYHAGKV